MCDLFDVIFVSLRDFLYVSARRPLSKTVRFNVLQVISEAAGRKKFSKF